MQPHLLILPGEPAPQAVSLEKPVELMSSVFLMPWLDPDSQPDPPAGGGFTEGIPPENNLSENLAEMAERRRVRKQPRLAKRLSRDEEGKW
jgi:hypothetical protein